MGAPIAAAGTFQSLRLLCGREVFSCHKRGLSGESRAASGAVVGQVTRATPRGKHVGVRIRVGWHNPLSRHDRRQSVASVDSHAYGFDLSERERERQDHDNATGSALVAAGRVSPTRSRPSHVPGSPSSSRIMRARPRALGASGRPKNDKQHANNKRKSKAVQSWYCKTNKTFASTNKHDNANHNTRMIRRIHNTTNYNNNTKNKNTINNTDDGKARHGGDRGNDIKYGILIVSTASTVMRL